VFEGGRRFTAFPARRADHGGVVPRLSTRPAGGRAGLWSLPNTQRLRGRIYPHRAPTF
jgi:hypothetical protein